MIRFYYMDVTPFDDEALFANYYGQLSERRRRKTDRYRFTKDKALCLGAGALLDHGLREYGLREKDMEYSFGEWGKPRFEGAEQIHFNLSHSGKAVVAAFSDDEIGCDVEKIKEADLELARRFLHPNEYEAIAQMEDIERRNELFFRIWTLKESFMKVTERGMTLPLNSFEIITDGAEAAVKQRLDTNRYFFKEFESITA